MNTIMYLVVIEAMLFALGATLFAIWILSTRRPPRWGAYVATKLGMFITSGILLTVVLPAKQIPIHWPSVGYVIGLLSMSIGLVGVARDIMRRHGTREGHDHVTNPKEN